MYVLGFGLVCLLRTSIHWAVDFPTAAFKIAVRPLLYAIPISVNLVSKLFSIVKIQKYSLSAIFWHFDSQVNYSTFQNGILVSQDAKK